MSTGQRAHAHFLSHALAGANVDIDRRALTCPVNANVHQYTLTESDAYGQGLRIRKRSAQFSTFRKSSVPREEDDPLISSANYSIFTLMLQPELRQS